MLSRGPSLVAPSHAEAIGEVIDAALGGVVGGRTYEQYKDIARRATSEVIALNTTDATVVANIVNRLRGDT